MSNDTYSHLHDRFTRGELLSEDELSVLHSWYTQQDAEEMAHLHEVLRSTTTITHLQEHINHTAAQLQQITQHITATISENETLRHEIALLQARLAHQLTGRAA